MVEAVKFERCNERTYMTTTKTPNQVSFVIYYKQSNLI